MLYDYNSKRVLQITVLFVCGLCLSLSQVFAADLPDTNKTEQTPVNVTNAGHYFILGNNEQAPFALFREFSFTLLQASNLELVIYDIEGQLVRNLVTDYLESGDHVIVWDGNNNKGEPVKSGVYRYSLRVHDLEQSQIITYLR